MGDKAKGMDLTHLWSWPADLDFAAVKDLSNYKHKESLYVALIFASCVFFMTKNPQVSLLALIFFIGNKIGTLASGAVIGFIYGYFKRNVVFMAVSAGVFYYASGGRL